MRSRLVTCLLFSLVTYTQGGDVILNGPGSRLVFKNDLGGTEATLNARQVVRALNTVNKCACFCTFAERVGHIGRVGRVGRVWQAGRTVQTRKNRHIWKGIYVLRHACECYKLTRFRSLWLQLAWQYFHPFIFACVRGHGKAPVGARK